MSGGINRGRCEIWGGGGGELVLGLADEVVAACEMREDPGDLDARAAAGGLGGEIGDGG